MTPEQSVVGWSRSMLGQPFEWGRTDCAMVTLQALERLTGKLWAAAYRGIWGSEAEALEHFRLETPSEVLQRFGAVEVPVVRVVFGDVLAIPANPWPETLHFCLGARCLTAGPERGVHLIPTRALRVLPGVRAWRVAPCLKPYL